jgi:hypothetical protein
LSFALPFYLPANLAQLISLILPAVFHREFFSSLAVSLGHYWDCPLIFCFCIFMFLRHYFYIVAACFLCGTPFALPDWQARSSRA